MGAEIIGTVPHFSCQLDEGLCLTVAVDINACLISCMIPQRLFRPLISALLCQYLQDSYIAFLASKLPDPEQYVHARP